MPTLEFFDILAWYATSQTSARKVLDIMEFLNDDGTEGVRRTQGYFMNWISSTATPPLLTKMIQAMTGQTEITPGLKLYVHQVKEQVNDRWTSNSQFHMKPVRQIMPTTIYHLDL